MIGQVFPPGKRENFADDETPSQCGSDFLAEHPGIAAGNHHTESGLRQPADELLPAVHILDFVEVYQWFPRTEHLLITVNGQSEFLGLDIRDALIFEVDVEAVLERRLGSGYPFLDILEQQPGFSSPPDTR